MTIGVAMPEPGRHRRRRTPAVTAVAALAVLVAVSACGPATTRQTVDTDKSFGADSRDAIVVAGVRVALSDRAARDVLSTNKLGLGYGITWSKYDPSTDRRTKDRSQDFIVSLGLDTKGQRSCKRIDEWQYCIHDVEPGFYVLASTSVAQESAEQRQGRSRRRLFVAERTSLGAGRSAGGVGQIADSIAVSQSGAQRFELKAGTVYHLGEYTLSQYAQVLGQQFNALRASQLLADYPRIYGAVTEPVFEQPYRLQLRTGFCPHLYFVEPQAKEFTTANPCAP